MMAGGGYLLTNIIIWNTVQSNIGIFGILLLKFSDIDVKFHERGGGLCSRISPFVKYTYLVIDLCFLSKIIKNADFRPLSG